MAAPARVLLMLIWGAPREEGTTAIYVLADNGRPDSIIPRP